MYHHAKLYYVGSVGVTPRTPCLPGKTFTDYLDFFSCCSDKIPWQRQLRGERVYCGLCFHKRESIVVVKTWQQARYSHGIREDMVAGHISSSLRQHRIDRNQGVSIKPTCSMEAPTATNSTNFPNRDTSWGPSLQTQEPMVPLGAVNIQTLTPTK